MKTTLLTMLVALLLGGCMTFTYEKPDGTKVSYSAPALFGRQVDKLSATRDGDDVLFELEAYKSESSTDLARGVAEGVARGLTK